MTALETFSVGLVMIESKEHLKFILIILKKVII